MRRNTFREIPIRLLISTFWILGCVLSVSAASGQTLEFQAKVTPAYEAYLIKQAETLAVRIAAGGNQERVLSDRMALALVKMGQIHVEADRAFHRLDAVTDDIKTQRGEIEDLLKNELLDQDTESLATVLNGLRRLFTGSRYEDLKRRVKSVRDNLKADRDEVGSVWEDFQEALEAHLDVIQEHLDALKASRAPFFVRFHILGGDFDRTDEFEVSRANLDDVEAVEDAFRSTLDETRDAVDLLRGTLKGEGGDNAAAVAGFRTALKQVRVALDTLGTALDAQPLSVAGKKLSLISDIRGWIQDVQGWVSDADALLAGRTYELEGAVVRPIALVENLTERPEDIFLDFYRSKRPEAYTFRGLFPKGLSKKLLDLLSADMVLNITASKEEMAAHVRSLKERFQARLKANALDAEANAGMAITQTYLLASDNHQNAKDLIQMAQDGDLSGIARRFDVKDFDYRASLDSTRVYLQKARLDPNAVFMILVKLDEEVGDPFEVSEGDAILPVPMTGEMLGQALDISEEISRSGTDLVETIGDLVDKAGESFELDLDPNLLDFTRVESGLDFARALERSNRRFLWITPTGVRRMKDAGDDLRKQLADFSDGISALRDLVDAIHNRDEDLHLDTARLVDSVHDLDVRYREVRADFETSKATTRINGEAVNLSAWFDTPPDSLLQRLIWFLDDDKTRDRSMGGLFPERAKGGVTGSSTPSISLSVTSLAFGNTNVGATAQKMFTISNTGTASLSVTGITVSGTDASQFKVSPTTATVAAGGNQTVTVTFAPTSTGAKSASLSVAHSASSPVASVALSGLAVTTSAPPATTTLQPKAGDGTGALGAGDAKTRTLGSVKPGQRIEVPIAFNQEVAASNGFSVTLTFDPKKLKLSGGKGDGVYASAVFPGPPQVKDNTVTYAGAFLGSSTTAKGSIAVLTFETLPDFTGETEVVLAEVSIKVSGGSKEFKPNASVVITSKAVGGLASDFDGDGEVGFSDFFEFAAAFGQKATGANAKFDLDGDGEVAFGDFFTFAGDFGKTAK